jgi:cyclopropane-fatty-acyl-phospholipid synthase
VIDAASLRAAGTSPAAIAHHYDLSDEFFALWLGDDLVYSCALWEGNDPRESLEIAQRRKLDFFARELGVRGGRLLDIGCGWGALLNHVVCSHGVVSGTGLTLSEAQAAFARGRRVPGVDFRVESWVDHEPEMPYDAITCIEATEHLASDRLTADEKVAVYRAFFDRCAAWLRDDGRLGLQLICLDNVGHEGSRPGRGASSELIRVDIFPESMPGSLSELVLGWETRFQLERFLEHHDHYRRTFRAWGLAYRAAEPRARALVGEATARAFARYFAAGETFFRLREDALYRVILRKRPQPKRWVSPLRPSDLAPMPTPSETHEGARASSAAVVNEPRGPAGASAAAVQSHYDVSNDFYALWLGPTMMYSSGLWSSEADDPADLDAAQRRKIDFFARCVPDSPGADVLDVGCGWGGNLRRLMEEQHAGRAVGLTLSAAQCEFLAARPVPGADVRLESWTDHEPARPYDAIVSYGAFEHFARDGTTSVQRVHTYRRFFGRCFDWLKAGGRLGVETITHDGAPDTASPLGRGPLGDVVLAIYPESICPHLGEIVLGFEPYFEVEVLRSDAADFARTLRLWHLALRAREAEAAVLVGADTVRRFRRYLVSSEVQFRARTLTNTRMVLRRRPRWRW